MKATNDAVVGIKAKGEEVMNNASKVAEGNVLPEDTVTDSPLKSEDVDGAGDNKKAN